MHYAKATETQIATKAEDRDALAVNWTDWLGEQFQEIAKIAMAKILQISLPAIFQTA